MAPMNGPQDSYGDLTSADVVVVGAGLGGLVVAAYLAVAGKRVVVVDKHSVAGGNATVFEHHGYEFDVGVHYVGDCRPGGGIPSILEPLGIEIEFAHMDPDGFDTFIFGDGTRFRVPEGEDAFRARLHEAFPDEAAAVDGYVDAIVQIDAELRGKAPMDLMARSLDRTLGDLFDELGASPRLRTVLAGQHGTYAQPPSRASLILHSALLMHYLRGAFYPVGSGQVIADRLVDVIRAHGGDVVLRTPVTEICIDDGAVTGVRLHPPSPERRKGVPDAIAAPLVVSNADLKRTVTDLVGAEHLPADLVERVEGFEMSLPLHVLYLIIDRDLAAEGHPNTNLWVFPSDDVERDYAMLEAGEMPEQPMAYLTFASLKDPSNERLCRPGQTNVQVMTLVPSDLSFWGLTEGPAHGERYRRNETYLARKAEIREKLLAVAEVALPGITDAIVYEEAASPVTHERYTWSTGGTSYGIACTPEQFALNRPGYGTPIEGLWLAGASTIGAHGIGGVMGGGVQCATAILGEDSRALARRRLA